jgi:hypothetical protein
LCASPAPPAGGAPLLDSDGVSPATALSPPIADGVLVPVPAVVSSPHIGGGVLLLAAESSPLVGDGIVLPAATFSPPARVAFALPAAAALLPVWPGPHSFVVPSSVAADYSTLPVHEDVGPPNSELPGPPLSEAAFTLRVVALDTPLVREDAGLPNSEAIDPPPSKAALALRVVEPLALPSSNGHIRIAAGVRAPHFLTASAVAGAPETN